MSLLITFIFWVYLFEFFVGLARFISKMMTIKDETQQSATNPMDRIFDVMAWLWGDDMRAAHSKWYTCWHICEYISSYTIWSLHITYKIVGPKDFEFDLDKMKKRYFKEVLLVDQDDSTLTKEQKQNRVALWHHHLKEVALLTILFFPSDQRAFFQHVCDCGFK